MRRFFETAFNHKAGKMTCRGSKLIYLLGILVVLGVSSFGCKSEQPTPPAAQTSIPAPPDTQGALPILPDAQTPFGYAQGNSLPSPPDAQAPPATPQNIQADPPVPPQTQVYPPVPPETQAYQQLQPETKVFAPNPAKPQTSSPKPAKPQTSSPAPAKPQTAPDNNQDIKNLPDGNYFYGESPEVNQPGSKYLVFTKTGNVLIGQEYLLQTDNSHCFKGTADVNTISNVKIAYFEPAVEGAKWSFDEMESIKISELHQHGFEKAPEFATQNLQECIKVLSE